MNDFKPTDNNNHNNNNKTAIRVPHTDLTKPMEAGIEAIKGAQALMRQFGKQVEPALFSLLCDTQSENRATVDKALKNGTQSASEVLIPLLISQFSISPAIATMVSAVTIQAIATVGQEKLCRSLAEAGADKQLAAYKLATAKPVAVNVPVVPTAPEVELEAEADPRTRTRPQAQGQGSNEGSQASRGKYTCCASYARGRTGSGGGPRTGRQAQGQSSNEGGQARQQAARDRQDEDQNGQARRQITRGGQEEEHEKIEE